MADTNWFRLLGGQRSRTPQLTRPVSPCSEPTIGVPQINYDSNGSDDDERSHSNGPLRRLSSWHGLENAPPVSPTYHTSCESLVVRETDRIWHKPSVEQMAEALRVFMMTTSTIEALPREYNAYVLHLIEGYCALQNRLNETESRLVEAEAQREREKEEAAALAVSVALEKAQFRAEIKRLEKVIHTGSQGGLEAVMMARSGSLIRSTRKQATGPEDPGTDGMVVGDDVPSGPRPGTYVSPPHEDDQKEGIRLADTSD